MPQEITAKHRILYGYRGSHAHNLYVPPTEESGTDDIDFMGVVIPPIRHYMGLGNWQHKEMFIGNHDIVLYEITKFVRMLLKSNPNVLSFLWNKEDMFTEVSEFGRILIDHRHLFSSKEVYKAFKGYAYSQYQKIEKNTYQGYMGSKRKELHDKYGYDVKFAAHALRLLKMGCEFLLTGEMNVYRTTDRQQFIDIKQGKVSKEVVVWLIKENMNWLDECFQKSVLPDKIDVDKVEGLLYYILAKRFSVGERNEVPLF